MCRTYLCACELVRKSKCKSNRECEFAYTWTCTVRDTFASGNTLLQTCVSLLQTRVSLLQTCVSLLQTCMSLLQTCVSLLQTCVSRAPTPTQASLPAPRALSAPTSPRETRRRVHCVHTEPSLRTPDVSPNRAAKVLSLREMYI